MRNKGLKVLASGCVFLFLVTAAPSFAATKHAPNTSVKAVQTALNKEGYSLAVDGKMGKQTQAALRQYQKANGLAVTGKADAATKAKLGVK